MARVTVEDCIEIIPNRFDLVVTAAQRAKQIASGVPLTLDRDNDKDSVVSLREIAEKTINMENVEEEMVQRFQKTQRFDPSDRLDDEDEAIAAITSVDPDGGMQQSFSASESFVQNNQSYGPGMSFIEDNIEVED